MRFRSRKPLRSIAGLTLIETFLILTASAASETPGCGHLVDHREHDRCRSFYTATVLTDERVLVDGAGANDGSLEPCAPAT